MSKAAHLKAIQEIGSVDRTAILAVIRQEADAFAAGDFALWSSCLLRSPRTTEVTSGVHGLLVHRGWQNVSDAMEKTMRDDPESMPLPSRYVDFEVSISADTAWVTYFSTCQVTGDERFDMPDLFETRVLEKHNGRWLIVYMSVLALRSGSTDPTRILVDHDGQLVWATEATLKALNDHPHLTISAGRLRATRPAWDKVLQDAIKRASQFNHLTQFEKDALVSRDHLVFPIILGEDDDGGVQSCIVYARDGGTYVTFDDGHQVSRSLEPAKIMFGLSDAQTRLAETIAAGFGPSKSAKKLGISVNTVRTHLNRIYEKTGVNTQTALVRVLLSVSITGP